MFAQASTCQATDACQRIVLHESNLKKKVRLFLSKKLLLKSSFLTPSLPSFTNTKNPYSEYI